MASHDGERNMEPRLLKNAQAGDVDAVNLLFEIYRPRLLSFLKQKVRDLDLAEELTQETFLKAFMALPNTDENLKFSSWIFTIARNVCIDYWRYTGRRPVSIPYDAEILAPEQEFIFCEDLFEVKEVRGIVKEILGSLSMRQKTAIALRDIEGYSYKESADLMNLTEAAFTSLLYRARINFVQEAIPVLYPRAKEIGFGYKECLTLLKIFSLSYWPENPAWEIALRSRNYFDGIAEMFDLTRDKDYPKELDEFLLSKARDAGNLVGADFGVGAGHYAIQMAGKFRQVKALDIAPKMIKCAKARVQGEGIQNISLNVGNIDQLPYPDESIDLGYCATVLHHIFDPEKSIREMVRTIKPGGSLVIADLAKHQKELLQQEKRDLWTGFDEKQFSIWLKKAGLEDIWIEKPKDFHFNFGIEGKKIKAPIIIAGGKKPLRF